MNTQVLAVQETEYAGVTFRSKSEAILARTFDLNGFFWEYEPEHLQTGDLWVPDFLMISQSDNHLLWMAVIEFKPRGVTAAYRKLLANRFDQLRSQFFGPYALLICGSPFDEDIPRTIEQYFPGVGAYEELDQGFPRDIFDRWDEAKTYRFDLA